MSHSGVGKRHCESNGGILNYRAFWKIKTETSGIQVDRPKVLRVRSKAEIKLWVSLAHRENWCLRY